MIRRRAIDGAEADAFSRRWRRLMGTGAGKWAWVKKKANRRERREGKGEIKEQLE